MRSITREQPQLKLQPQLYSNSNSLPEFAGSFENLKSTQKDDTKRGSLQLKLPEGNLIRSIKF